MNSKVIEHILSTNPFTANAFQGFGSFDVPLPRIHRPAIIIFNTDRSEGPGEHWCVANFPDDNICEFFDPYGLPPTFYKFDAVIRKKAKRIFYNAQHIQGTLPTCGHHCLFYILKRYHGNSPACILEHMYRTENTAYNDYLAYNYIKREFGEQYAKFISY